MGSFLKRMGSMFAAPAGISPDARSHVVALARPFVNEPALQRHSKRLGMWVHAPQGVGIVTGCRIDAMVEVTLAKPDGSTVMALDENDKAVPLVAVCDLEGVHQAYIEDIPESRRGDLEILRKLGYQNRGAA